MSKLSIIEIYREDLNFSAGHFTIFSATHREKMHGHNYQVSMSITTSIEDNGLRFDYRFYHDKLDKICRQLDLTFLLPAHSKFLRIEEQDNYYHAYFDQEMIPFLKSDVIILPIENTTIEELSHWFLAQVLSDANELEKYAIKAITIKVSSNVGRSAAASWEKNK